MSARCDRLEVTFNLTGMPGPASACQPIGTPTQDWRKGGEEPGHLIPFV